MDRTGHKSSAMVNRYRRVARTILKAGLPPPTALHLAIPGVAAANTAADAAAEPKKEDTSATATVSKHTSKGLIAQSVELRTFNP
jgi:hypothetical protein